MDATDWLYELGSASDGNKVFPSAKCLKVARHKCITDCGIVEVEVRLVRWVKKGTIHA